MSIDSLLGGVTSLTNQVQTGLGTVTRAGADVGLTSITGTSVAWMARLRKASFRGVPFAVLSGDSSFGRRSVAHEYPFRDSVWVEDLGRAARRFEVQGFLVGDDCIAQREAMIAVCERKDEADSKLVHPTYGELTVTLVGRLRVTERWDKGRMFELSFSFIESGKREFPETGTAAGPDVSTKAQEADIAAAGDFKTRAAAALKSGASVVQKAVNATATWTATARRLSNDATNLVNMVSTIGGAVGRFANGRNVGGLSSKQSATSGSTQTVADLVALGSAARAAVSTAISSMSSSASGLSAGTTGSFASSAQALASTVSSSAKDPADAVRILGQMAQGVPGTDVSKSPIGVSQQAVQVATSSMFRRAAVVAMARASAAYQPASADDAAALRAKVCESLDAEIVVAGDQGADDVYNTLRALRAAVSKDLAERGAGLPTTVFVGSAQPLPALALAQRLYRDSARADELVTQSGCIHPAFMPTNFKALSG
jgi:prophage DNA circulation protein